MDKWKSQYLYAKAVADALETAYRRVDRAAFMSADALMAESVQSLQDIEDRAVESEMIEDIPLQSLRTDIRSLIDIARRSYMRDVRSVELRKVQRDDYKEALGAMRNRWQSEVKRAVLSAKSAPSYRYKIGDVVKLASNEKRTGKVVGVHRENGVGKQMYRVRMFDKDNDEIYGLSEIKLSK